MYFRFYPLGNFFHGKQFFSWLGTLGLCINWASTSLFVILGKLPTLNLPKKKPPFIKVAIFSDNFSVKLPWLQRRGTNLIPHYLTDIISNNCKAITFWKIAIIPNGNKLMFQVIFIFSDWILIEQITASSHPFCLGGNKKFYQEFWAGGGDRGMS